MPSRFKADLFPSAWGVLASVHGETVSIQPKGSLTWTDVTGILLLEDLGDASFDDGTEVHRRASLRVQSPAVVPGWTPAPGDLARSGAGTVYAVEKIVALEPSVTLQLLKIDERRFGGSGNYAKR